ncbi:MFS general substrate transporter [Teratosphaeria nubilosa]|uniref:MFS general substrate transporter n=1 Tax=Teratosphaeria nubilosa TaxID=161662 RepID=A0A6G1LEU8_9PEZI|nr:MFS general substrate transporter [Teratosphaeria nubilosa]
MSPLDESARRSDDVERDTDDAPLLPSADEGTAASSDNKLSAPRLIALTCINGGLQVFFATVMANLSPYLQKLGLSKSAAAPIIICLPLSGAFIGPTAGAFSDRLRTRLGRRRPIILGGAISTVLFLLLLAWTQELVELLSGGTNKSATGALAVVWTICMAISVQPVQAGVRSLMVDIAPAEQQNRAASFAGRIQSACAIFSFFASSLNLPGLPGLHRLSQFQALACLNFITLGSTVLITCIFIREKNSRQVQLAGFSKKSALVVLRHIFKTIRELRGRIRKTCETQFCSWFAWFPFLYYNTTYISEINTANMMQPQDDGNDALAQAGSLASLSFAIVGFIIILTLPILAPYIEKKRQKASERTQDSGTDIHSLIWLWIGTQPFLGVLLILTLAAAYQWQGIVLIAAAGLPWAVTQWVPFAIVGYETSRLGLTESRADEDEGVDSQAGVILGVHNMAISLPQVLSGLVSSGTYKIAEVAGSQVPTAWVLASSGVVAFVASFLARRLL